MDEVTAILQWATGVGLALVGLISVVQWLRDRRNRSRLHLAIAFSLLGFISLSGRVQQLTNFAGSPLYTDFVLLAFIGSAYAILRFRHSLIPFRRLTLIVASAINAAVFVFTVAAALPAGTNPHLTTVQRIAVIAFIAVWCGDVAEPVVRLWLVGRRLPAVQRSRMRALSGGLGGIVGILILAVVAEGSATTPAVRLGIQVLALLMIPLFFAAFSPPRWLRRQWRGREEEAYTNSLRDLMVYADDRATMAERSLEWAIRLLGGAGGLVVGPGATVLAFRGIAPDLAARMAASVDIAQIPSNHLMRLSAWPGQLTIVNPLNLSDGAGALIVTAGQFTPVFGADEVGRMQRYSTLVTIALDRVLLVEKLQAASQELRSARDQAQSANNAKSEYLSRMSHELRTPLTAILGFADLLEMDEPRDDQRERIEAILRATGHLLSLINDVLDIARVESGRETFSLEPVGVKDVVTDCVDLIAPRAARRRVSLTVSLDGSGDAFVRADRQRLRQVLLNLLSNAVTYNVAGGSIQVNVAKIDGDRCRISVKDTGVGIAEDKIDRLFQPFDRLGAERTNAEGTGLGLALSKRLMEAMSGAIGVISEAEKGSTFWLDLERTEKASLEPSDLMGRDSAAEREMDRISGHRTVLHIEDNLATVSLMEDIFDRRPNLSLITAMQGTLGVELAREHQPDLVLLDIHLPDINGEQVLERLRADSRTKHIPVVILSADATETQVHRLLNAGADAYLTKPIRVRELLKAFDSFLGRESMTVAAAADER